MNRIETIQEAINCGKDYSYYSRRYAHTYDETQGKKVPFEMFPQQNELTQNLMSHRFNIVPKSRQSGISTTTALFYACRMMFVEDRKVLIVAHKRDGAENFLKKVIDFIEERPKFLGITIVGKSKSTITLSNGSEARAFASSSDSLRSFTATDLVLDECAFIPNAKTLWTATSPTLSTGGRATFISTPNGMDELFYRTYSNAMQGRSDFHVTYIRWWRDSRYNKGLFWRKAGEDDIYEEEDEERMMELHRQGWKPDSPWFQEARKLANYNKKKIAQEYEIEFIGSSDTVISADAIRRAESEEAREPLRQDEFYPDLWYFREPQEQGRYILGSDVGSGSSADFSTIAILDADTYETMAEYCARVTPDVLARVIDHVGRMYNNALACVDVSGGMGVTTIVELVERYSYPCIYHSKTRSKPLQERLSNISHSGGDKTAGVTITTANRNLMVEEFAKLVRNGEVKVESKRLLSEIKTFIYKPTTNKPEHMRGYHDDILFAYMIATYVLAYDHSSVMASAEYAHNMLNLIIKSNKRRGTASIAAKPRSRKSNIFKLPG